MINDGYQVRRSPVSSPFQIPLICVGLAALVFAVFSQSFAFDFVNYDDDKLISKNTHILQGLNLENLYWSLIAGTGSYKGSTDYWRPLSLISHLTDIHLFGLHSGWHHAVNVLLHATNSVILFLLLRSMTGAIWRSAMVAALFAIHPLHVESVAWIAERKDVLSGLFFLLTLGAYTRYARRPSRPFPMASYLLVLCCSALAMMSKPMVVTIPCVLLLLDYWPLERVGKVSWGRLVVEKSPLFLMSFGVAWLTSNADGGMNQQMMESIGLWWRLGMAIVAYATYLKQMVWPLGMVVFYPHPGTSLQLWSVFLSLAVLLMITTWVIKQRKRGSLFVGWFWYVGMLFPVIGLIQSGSQSHADRYTYLPLIGIFIMIVWALADFSQRSPRCQKAMALVGGIMLLVLMAFAARQTSVWRNSKTLWIHSIEAGVDHPMVQNNLGEAFLTEGNMIEALPHFQRAIEMNSNDITALLNLGGISLMQGKNEEAVARFRHCLEKDPQNAFAMNDLGEGLMSQGKKDEAISKFREALHLDPTHIKATINLGNVFQEQGDLIHATECFRNVLNLAPNDVEVRQILGKIFYQTGKWADGIVELKKAYRIQPDNPQVANDLSWMLATAPDQSLRNGPQSLGLALAVDKVSAGKNPIFLDTLAAAYAENGKYAEALRIANHALELAETEGKKDLIKSMKEEITLYEAGKPVRDPR